MADNSPEFHVVPGYQPLMRMIGLDADAVFTHPDIHVWRKLPDRENCRLDADLTAARGFANQLPSLPTHSRLHIKRYQALDAPTPEVRGHHLLESANIPTAPLVGWGSVPSKGGFVIFDDLTGYTPADKLLEQGFPFEPLLIPTAQLAAQLHSAGLHHRDLYLCHFMARTEGNTVDLKLIDTARVKKLPTWFPRRWIVKDLAQFWYSTLKHPITDPQRQTWLSHYLQSRSLPPNPRLTTSILRKVRSISRHDQRLHQRRPERDVSIPA